MTAKEKKYKKCDAKRYQRSCHFFSSFQIERTAVRQGRLQVSANQGDNVDDGSGQYISVKSGRHVRRYKVRVRHYQAVPARGQLRGRRGRAAK